MLDMEFCGIVSLTGIFFSYYICLPWFEVFRLRDCYYGTLYFIVELRQRLINISAGDIYASL